MPFRLTKRPKSRVRPCRLREAARTGSLPCSQAVPSFSQVALLLSVSPRFSSQSQGLLIANAKGRWSRGSSESLLDQDIATIRDGGGYQQLLDRLTLQVGRLDIQAVDLEGRTSRSSLFKTMFLAFAQDGAKDWSSSLAISVKHSGAQDKLQFHHIFPKAYLRDFGPDLKPSQVDDISNLAFIGGSTNLKISAKAPSIYLTKLAERADHPLEAQQVPLDTSLYSPERYMDFLTERRELIAKRLNDFLA